MAYSTQSDLNLDSQRLVELTASPDASGVVDEDLVDQLLDESQAMIDEMLVGEYPVPFEDGAVPITIKYLSADIARYLVYKHRPEMDMPKDVRDDFDRAIERLKQIAAGDYPLPGSAVSPVAAASIGTLRTDDAVGRVFGRFKDQVG